MSQSGTTANSTTTAPIAAAAPLPQDSKQGRLCEIFTGSNPLIHVDDWIGLFTLVTKGFTDEQRIVALGRHVGGEAMRWLIRDIVPIHDQVTWQQVSARMITRFQRATHSFFNDAMDRELKANETIEEFFNDKRRLMALANIGEPNQVAALTRGIPHTLMRTQIAAAMPADTDAWLRVALVIEANVKRQSTRDFRDDRRPNNRSRSSGQQSLHVDDNTSFTSSQPNRSRRSADDRRTAPRLDFSRPPTTPCPLCRAINRREFHWKKDCPNLRLINANRDNSNGSNQPIANSQNTSSASTAQTDQIMSISANDFIWFDLTVNGHHVRAMLDSGSSVTAMSRATATRLQLKWDQRQTVPIKHVDGFTHSLGTISADVTLNGQHFQVSIQVLDRLGPDMLIGVNLARRAHLIVHFSPDCFALALHEIPQSNFMIALTTQSSSQPSIDDLVNRFSRVFAQDSSDFGRITGVQHEIRLLPNTQPFRRQPFRMSAPRETIMRKHIEDMLKAGIIRPSRSPYSCPAFLVPKGHNEWRPVVDFRTLNAVTIPQHNPLPNIRDLIDKLTGSNVFTTLDVAWGFWHVPLHPESIEKTSFVTTFGQFEFLFLPMGLKNSSSVFQRVMRDLLRDFLGHGVEQFLDDIIVHTSTTEEHMQLLERLLSHLADKGIKLRKPKCKFLQTEVEFLGHRVSAGHVQPSQAKVKAIVEFPTPTTVRTVREFLGLANFYRSFVKDFSSIVKPLTDLLKSERAFDWPPGGPADLAFHELKQILSTSPVLNIFDPALPCILWTDAPEIGLGAVLQQRAPDISNRTIAFWSAK